METKTTEEGPKNQHYMHMNNQTNPILRDLDNK